MVSFGPFTLQNLWGLYGLLSLIPLILLYLIKPKPKLIDVPSLMFFLKTMGTNKITSFLKQLTKDWLFIIQLLILLLTTLALLTPLIEYFHDISAAHTVLVLDASASMQAKEDGTTRFDKMIRKAKEVVSSRNTIILAKYYTKVGLQNKGKRDALDFLNALKPTDASTRLGDAILAAGSALEQNSKNKEGRIIVISDFINTEGQDAVTAKSILESKGIIVDFINIASIEKRNNVGFVKLVVDDQASVAYIKNFGSEPKKIELKANDLKKEITLAPEQVEPFSFQTIGGITRLEIIPDDDFSVDNKIFLSAPEQLRAKALLVTNNKSIFLENALQATKLLDLEIASPPIVPSGDYDLYFIQNINQEEVLTGTFEEIARKVEDGASVIIHAQEDFDKLKLDSFLNLPLLEKRRSGSDLAVQQINRFTKNADFGKLEFFWLLGSDHKLTPFVAVENNTIIGMQSKDKGRIIYYGIMEKASDFKFSPSYPIFWTELTKFLLEKQDLAQLNHPTKDFLSLLRPQEVELPSGKRVVTQTVLLEDAGIYRLPTQNIAANLLDEKESDITALKSMTEKSGEAYEMQAIKEKRALDLDPLILILLMLALAGELIYIKFRGML